MSIRSLLKRPLATVVTVSLGLGLAGLAVVPAQAAEASPVPVTDAALAACINASLGQDPADPIDPAQAATITSLTCFNNGVTSVDGISALTGLTSLDLGGNSITDIDGLAALTGLTFLSLGSNQVADITPLTNLTSLETLLLAGNRIADITRLSSMTDLTQLDLASNRVSSVTPLSGLTSLDTLFLHYNAIEDVSPLAGLTGVKHLLLNNNAIGDVSPLAPIAASVSAADEYVTALDQRISLADIAAGAVQDTPVTGFADAGDLVPVTSETGSAEIAPDGLSWTYSDAGSNVIAWDWTGAGSGPGDVRFSGTIAQESLPRPAEATTLADDTLTTPANEPVVISPLSNDGLTDEPALVPSTLTLLDDDQPATTVSRAGGEFTLSGETVSFTPAKEFSGAVDPVRYSVENADGVVATATILVTVTPVDDGGAPEPTTGPSQDPVDREPSTEPTSPSASATSPGAASGSGKSAAGMASAPLATTGAGGLTMPVLLGLGALLLGGLAVLMPALIRRGRGNAA